MIGESPAVSLAPRTEHNGTSGRQRGGMVGSMVARIRNQSEIAETRNQQNNYGTYDARAIGASGSSNPNNISGSR